MREVVRANLVAMAGEVEPCGPVAGSGVLLDMIADQFVGREFRGEERRLNLGCGRDLRRGWVNLDSAPRALLEVPEGVEYVQFDLDDCGSAPLPFSEDHFDVVEASHLIEHVLFPLDVAQALHRVSKAGCEWRIKCPHGASDDAWGDLTHRRAWFPESFLYFGQPTYWRADYGYRGDWKLDRVILRVSQEFVPQGVKPSQVLLQTRRLRNVVLEMEAVLSCVKPIRLMDRSQMDTIRHEIEVLGV